MNKIRVLVVLALALLISEPHHLSHAQPTDSAMTKQPASARDMYLGLRALALTGRIQSDAANANYGIVLDMPIDENTVTLALHGDGTVSLYYSNGGGLIGVGQANPEIATVARDLIDVLVSQESYIKKSKSFQPATSYPLPAESEASIYFKTPTGILLARANMARLDSGKHELSALWQDLQALLGRVLRAGNKKS